MGNKSTGFNDQWIDHKAKSKSRAKKSVEKLEEKLKGKRMIPDPGRKGCYIYVDSEPVDQGNENIGLDFESGEIVAVWDIGLCPEEFRQENEIVDELDHVKQMGPSFGAYPVELNDSPFKFELKLEGFVEAANLFADMAKGISDILASMVSLSSEFEKSARLLKDLHSVKDKKPTYKSRLKNLVKNYRKKETHFTGK